MDGYFLTFFTQQNRTHEGVPLAEWLVARAREIGVRGATVIPGREGFGDDGRFHSDGFFDMEDRPIQVEMVLADAECDRLLAEIAARRLRIFYTRSRVEFGHTSGS